MNIKDKFSNAKPEVEKDNVVNFKSEEEWTKINPLVHEKIMAVKLAPTEMVMSPWLPVQGVSFIYAATGVGKTLFTLNIAYAIAGGGKFLKYQCPKPRKVLYIDGEMSYKEVYFRYTDIVKQQGELFFKENFHLFNPEAVLPYKLPKICSPEGQSFYNYKIKELGIEVLVLDNLSTLSAIDENNSEQWKLIQDWLIDLRSKGLTIIVVHHAGKDKKGYRGTSRMLDIVNTAISLQDITGDQLESEMSANKTFKIEYQKKRGFSGKDALPFEVSLTDRGWVFQSMESTNLIKISEMLNNGMRQVNIARELSISESYVSKIAKIARRNGMLKE